MTDNLSHFKPLDPGRILVDDALELQYWCKELGCTRAELLAAIAKVGDHVTAVRDQLASSR